MLNIVVSLPYTVYRYATKRKTFYKSEVGKQPAAKIQIAIEMLTVVSFLGMAGG
jgi:hypothetical protein